ncbi:MAG TPA: amylo-alpha-1,6-glucosidase [Candidatus Binatia bacterium]|nr:amylo-alpha-1,6-glucosidase [Candidatus Binatia bacterium]
MGEFQQLLRRLPPLPSAADFGREVCGEIAAAEAREWLVANGIGGFACGTVAGNVTRRYHGLLVAALRPPVGRTLLVSNVDATAEYLDDHFPLTPQRWWNAGRASVATEGGQKHIERFRLEGTTPVWSFALADALVEKRVWMQPDENTTYVVYTLARASAPLRLALKALVNYRDYHSGTHAGNWWMNVEPVARGLRITAFEGATPFYLLSQRAAAEPAHDWYRNFDLPAERQRGLNDHEDHLHAGSFRATLNAGESVGLVLSTRPDPVLEPAAAYAENTARQKDLLDRWTRDRGTEDPRQGMETPDWIRQLVLAADQFIAVRPLADDPGAKTVLAGFPWFTDWGRDTMIALPGLTLSTGRPEIARSILRTFARFVDGGMLPNYFPDAGTAPEYNTVDATLWFFEAARQYYQATRDGEFLREIFPVLEDIAEQHRRGTRHRIHVDPADGLLYAGETGVQLTWMDARVGDRVITPRIGKPVEINALWHNALLALGEFAAAMGKDPSGWNGQAQQVRASFQRFWNAPEGCCYDVLDGPQGHEAAVRPNQIFAVSLPQSPLSVEQQAAVVETCARRLVTSFGLRSLAPGESGYVGHYEGEPAERDGAYHQGTVWGWLAGPFALAWLRVHKDPARALEFLQPMEHHVHSACVGSISEIFDGDPPFGPCGCFAQAWSVAEVLRAWTEISRARGLTIAQ